MGALGRVTERNIASFTPSKRGLENLFLNVLIATPVGHYFTSFLQVGLSLTVIHVLPASTPARVRALCSKQIHAFMRSSQ